MNKKLGTLLVLLLSLLSFVGCSSFPRSTVSTEEQDMTLVLYDSAVTFTPDSLDTIYLNRTIFLLDSADGTESGIHQPDTLFNNIKRQFEKVGYTVKDTVIEKPDTTFSGTLINISEAVNEFTMYYYYSYWYDWYGYYYPPYYYGGYTYTYTVATIIVGMQREGKQLWTGTISGFTDTGVIGYQTKRIARGVEELFTLAPFKK